MEKISKSQILTKHGVDSQVAMATSYILDQEFFRHLVLQYDEVKAREHEGTERDTEGVDQDMSIPLKSLLVSGSMFSGTSA